MLRTILGLVLATTLAFASATAVDLEGRPVDPRRADGARASVLVFVREDCPISNRYAPEIRRLGERFSVRGVAFWLVFPDPAASADSIRAHLAEFDLPLPALRDPDHALVRAAGVRVTPEAAVYDAKGRLVYSGRIDDRYVDFGTARAEPASRDLERSLEAVLAGRKVRPARTKAVGCFIADLAP